ncbi:MAG: hypothetical protein H0T46_36255 [Deltaproteobacteria bacterium]|nr:hypothetical protein [Deltaproteobacteria bacterium]
MPRLPLIALVACALFASSFATADRKAPSRPDPIVGRVVGLEVYGGDTVVTVAAGKSQGIAKGWRAAFLDGTTKKPLAGGEAIVIRIDRRTSVLKTRLSPEQVRANRLVQFNP